MPRMSKKYMHETALMAKMYKRGHLSNKGKRILKNRANMITKSKVLTSAANRKLFSLIAG